VLKLRQQEIVMKLIDAFDVGKYPRHNLIGKHVMLAVGKNHLEMKHLQHNETNTRQISQPIF